MLGAYIALLAAATVRLGNEPAAVAGRQEPEERLRPAAAALSLARDDSTFLPREITADAILADLGVAYRTAGRGATLSLDSLASRLGMRVAVRPYESCGASNDMSGRLRRAACAFQDATYYLEFTEIDIRSDSAFVTIAIFHRVPPAPRRQGGAVAALWRAIGRPFARERRVGTSMQMQHRMVRLRRDGEEWKALGFVSP